MTFKYTIGTIIIIYTLIVTAIMLIGDLHLVLTSYGSWAIFIEKFVMSFIAIVALIALIKGKIGIELSRINEEKEGTENEVSLFILLNVVLSVIFFYVIKGGHDKKIEILENILAIWIWLSIFGFVVWAFSGDKIMNKILGKKKDKKSAQAKKSVNELIDIEPMIDEVISPHDEPISYPVDVGFFVYKSFKKRKGYADIKALVLFTYKIHLSTESYLDILDKFKYPTHHQQYYKNISRNEFIAMQYILDTPYEGVAEWVRTIYNKELLKYKYIEYGKKIQKRIDNGKPFEEAVKMRDYSEFIFWIAFISISTIIIMLIKH